MDAAEFGRLMERAVPDWGPVQEIRLRTGRPVMILTGTGEFLLGTDGKLLPVCKKEACGETVFADGSRVVATVQFLREVLEAAAKHSLYAFEDEIRQGFLTVPGGHRVGISGKAVLDGDRVRILKEISGLNVRLSHQKPGCADGLLPWLYEDGRLLSTLLLSPPGGGKTTMLRDLIRQVSDGGPGRPGLAVSVVDERSELAACYQGAPQNDLGLRTDVLDCCPKAQGMMMMIRSMGPRAVAVDEIGAREDLEAMRYVMNCGCKILATVHGNSIGDLEKKPVVAEMVRERLFDRYAVLKRMPHPGAVEGIYDRDLKELGP